MHKEGKIFRKMFKFNTTTLNNTNIVIEQEERRIFPRPKNLPVGASQEVLRRKGVNSTEYLPYITQKIPKDPRGINSKDSCIQGFEGYSDH